MGKRARKKKREGENRKEEDMRQDWGKGEEDDRKNGDERNKRRGDGENRKEEEHETGLGEGDGEGR